MKLVNLGKHFTDRWTDAKLLVFAAQLVLLASGAILYFVATPHIAGLVWATGAGLALVSLLIEIAISILHGQFALDVIAALAMAAALLLGEYLTGIIIALMYSGGQALEVFAQGRVKRAMDALLAAAPRTASRFTDGHLEEVAVSDIMPGDRIMVRRGEVVPVDGRLSTISAVLDQSTLTGESLPVHFETGASLLSGATNAGDAFEMHAERTSAESTYSGIVRLVEGAQTSKSPIMRVADRYASVVLLITSAASTAAWLISGDPLRALAVLVVATPCPLILAVPIAILSGVSHCARKGILVKGGEALERLSQIRTVLLDKTGTITDGRAQLVEVQTFENFDAQLVLRLAASLDQGSNHVLAEAIISAARKRGLSLHTPEKLKEEPGRGIEGEVDGYRVALGGFDFMRSHAGDITRLQQMEDWARRKGLSSVVVMVNDRVVGVLLLADRIRPEAPTVLRRLKESGIDRVVLLTGDNADVATTVAVSLGIDDVRSDMKPQDKIAAVIAEKARGRVLMVGDGVNDAPALAAADVGVAMGARGAAASSEAADVVLLVDRLDRLVTALQIAGRARSIALQSAFAGVALSGLAMVAAMLGYLPPIGGALLQELIDVAVILNALRALGEPLRLCGTAHRLGSLELGALEEEHLELAGILDEIRDVADKVPHLPAGELLARLTALNAMLVERLLPHEKRDEGEVHPRLGNRAPRSSEFAGLSRSHMEIQSRSRIFGLLVISLSSSPEDMERREIQRVLDGLEAIVRLHFEQEEELYRMLESN
jgi:heavy metal translocating P-type ATPase